MQVRIDEKRHHRAKILASQLKISIGDLVEICLDYTMPLLSSKKLSTQKKKSNMR